MPRRIEVHIDPQSTAPPSYHTYSVWQVVGVGLAFFLAVMGFLSFSPLQVFQRFTDINLFRAYDRNKELQISIQGMDKTVDSLELRIQQDDSLRAQVAQIAGIPKMKAPAVELGNVETVADPYGLGPVKYLRKIRKAHADFKSLRDTLLANPSYASSLPILHPLQKHKDVTSRFELVFDPRVDQQVPHKGIDYAAQIGDTIIAPGAGMVASVVSDRGYGLSVTILHNSRMETFYAHLDRSLVSPGQAIRRGQPIALIGSSGLSSGPHLHYEMRFHGQRINPEHYFITP